MTLKPFLASVFVLFLTTLNISGSTKTIQESKGNVSKRTNQSYYVDGESDASLFSASDTDFLNPKVLLEAPDYSNWNMMSKNLSDGTIDFFAFDENDYYYRQFAYDETSVSVKSKAVSASISSKYIRCPEPSKSISENGSISLYAPGYNTGDAEENVNDFSIKTTGIIGDDNRTKIDNTSEFPYRASGQIEIAYNNVLNKSTGKYESLHYIATGFLVGPDVLVTAGHNLYSDITVTVNGDSSKEDNINNPRFPDSITYYPARNGSIDPYGGIPVERIYLEDTYYIDQKKDWGCCKLSRKTGLITGWLGMMSNFYEKYYSLISFGYPGSKGRYMYQSSGIMTEFEDNGWYYRTTLDTEGGQSGSPYRIHVNDDDYVCGIHTYTVGDSYTGGIRIDNFMFSFLNSFIYGDLLYEITPSDYGFADAYPTDDTTATEFQTHTLKNGLTFRTRRYRTGYIQNEYIVMSSIRHEIAKKEAFIEYSFNAPINRIQVALTYWREISTELIKSSNGSAYLQVKDGDGWSNIFDLLSDSTNLPTDRSSPTTYTINFQQPIYVFRFYSEYHGLTYNSNANRGRLCIGNMTIWQQYDNYMPLNGDELEYDPSAWEDNYNQYNCYAYALNTKNHGYMQPGQSEGHNRNNTDNYYSKDVLLQMISLDAQKYNFKFIPIGKYNGSSPGFYKVALVVAPSKDYHWYRQNYDGTWSHKLGTAMITNLDNSMQKILDPEYCDRDYWYDNYTEFCGFYEVDTRSML